MRLIDIDIFPLLPNKLDGDESEYERGYHDATDNLKALPLVDAVPVVRGRWDDSGRYTFPSGSTAVRCTNCGCALTESEYHLNNWNYCPVCGVKMDGGADHEAD